MTTRRDLLVSLSCIAVLGTAELLRPRQKLTLMPSGQKLKDIVPSNVSVWSRANGGDIVVPRTEGTLATRLYSDQLARAYQDPSGSEPEIMVLVAYGSAQSDVLQLHRPEICYPALGFEITERNFVNISVRAGKSVPAVALTARQGSRVEDIIYWTRLGNTLPQDASQQRADRLDAAIAGYIPDGVLFRASAIRSGEAPTFQALTRFMSQLVDSLQPSARLALLGPSVST